MPVSFRRFTAAFLCLALLAADPTYAAGAASLSPDLGIPSSLGRIEEFHRGRSGKTLIFIQDAHDSFEAQTHIAALVRHLVEERGVRTVYEEGYEGAVPTDAYFGFIADPALKEKVSYFLMDQLRIGGAEYAHVNRTRDFKLIGADSIGLHLKNIGKYREAAEARDEIQSDLAALRRPLEILAAQVFPKELKEWRRLKDRYDGGKLDLPSYLNRFEALAGGNPPASIALLLAAAKSSKPEDQARAEALDPVSVFRDLDAWENAFAAAKLQDERGRKIFGLLKRLKLLERLNRIEVSAEEYQAAQDALRGLKTQAIADFIARETHKPVLLSKRWENSIENALLFYETARARDAAVKAALESFAASEESTAALVFGGFHKDRILAHLKELGLSYAVVSPLISGEDPRHHAYYEQLMSDGNHPFEIPYRVSRASRNASIFLVPAGQAELRAVTQSVERFAGSPLEILTRQVEGDLADRVRRGELRTAAESGALKEFYLPLAAMIALGVRREETTKGPAPQKIFQVLREKDFAFLATLPEKETRAYLPLKAFPVTRDMPAAVNPGEFVVVYERLAHQYIAARVLGAEGKTYTAGEFAALARASAPALPAEKAYRYFAPTVTDWGLVMEANGLAASTPDAPGAYSLDEVQGKPFEHLPVDKRKESNTRAGILYRLAAAQGSGASYGRAEVWVEEKKAWLSFEDTMAYRRQRAEVPASLNLHHYLTQRALVPNNRRPDRPISMRELDALAGGHEITGIALLPGGGFGDPTEWWHNTTLKRDASGRIIDFDVKKYMEPARLRMAPFHEGVDVFIAVNEYGDFAYVPPGTGVRSAAEGRVAAIIPDVMGETVVVEHPLRNASGDRAYTLYSHVKSKVRVGDRVTEDTIVAEIADPGPEWKGAPPHLHFSLMWVPEDFEKTAGRKLDWSEYHKEFMPYNPFFMPFYLADIQHGLPIRDAAVPQGMKILERPDDPLQNIADGLTAMLRPAYLEFIYSFSEGRSAGGIILPPSGPSARQIELLQTILDLFELLGPKAEGARPMLLTFLNAVEKLRVAHGNFPAGIRRALRSIDGAPAVPLISHSKTIADKLAALLRLSDDEYVQGLAIELLGELGPAAGDALMSLAMQMGFYEGKAAQQGPFRFFYPLLAVLGALGQIRSEYPVSLLEEFTASPHHEALFEHLNHPLQQKAQDALRAIREKTAAPVSSVDRQVSRLISLIKISAFLYRQDPEAAPALFSLYSHEIRDRLFQLGPRAVKAGPALGELAEAASRAGDGATVELLQYLMRVIGFYFDEIPRKLAGEFYIPGLEIRAQIFQALEVLDGEVVVTVRVDGWKVEAHKESAGLEFDFNVKQELWNPEAFRRDAERFLRERLRLNAQGFLSRDDFYYGPLRELPTLAGASALHPEEKPTNTITITDDPPHAELRVPSPARGILRKRAELRTNLESPAILEDIRSRGALVFQWNAREEGKRFDQISEATLRRRVKQKGYNVIWMTGIWKPGKFTETFNKMWDPKRVGSAYSIEDYVINPDLGDEDSFMAFVDRANRLGIKVIADFIPNHMGADSTWIQEDPHYFLQGGPEDEATASLDDYTKGGQAGFVQRLYFMAAGPDGPVKISHGRDVGGPWIDTAQLDYAYPPLRPKLLETMRKIIRLTRGGGLRLDAADRTTRAAFLKMYGRDIGTEFWPDAFAALKAEFPTALFASETFWNDQQAFLNFGSDYVYDIPFYNLVVGTEKPSAQEITRHLTHTPFDTQKTLRSIENHDLPDGMRVLALLGKPRTQAAAILMLAGGPGAVMLYDGQIEGRTKEKPSAKHVTLHKRRETFDRGLQKFYEAWLKRTHDPLFRKGEAFEIAPGLAQRGIVAVRRSFEGREALVLVNYSASRARLDYAPEGAAWGMKGEEAQKARWRNAETGTARRFARAFGFDMKPWEYRVYFLEKPGRTELRAEDGAPQAGQPAPDNLERTFNFAVLATDLAIASAAGALAVFLVTLRLDLGLAGLAFWGATVLPTVIGLGILKALYYPWAKISTRWPTYGWGIPFAGLFGGAAAWAVQAWWGSGPQVQAWLSSGMLSAAAGFLIIKSLHDFFHALFFGDFDLAAEQDDLPRKPNRIHHYTETPSHYEIVSRPDEYTEIKIYIFKGDHPNLSIVRNRYLGEGEQRIVERSESLKRDGETITVRAWNEIEDPGLSPARNLSDADVLASWKEWAVSMMDLMDEMAAEVVMRGGVAEDDALRQRLAEEVGAIETYLKRAELRADDETAGEAEAEPEVRDPLERIVIGETAADWKEAQKIMRAAGAELDAGQERTLLAALHAPNLETAERRQLLDFLSTQYLNLIRYVARGMKLEGEAFDEAVQNGFFGLVEGLVRFDPAHETRLSTYAVWWIRHAIQRGESLETRPLSEHYRNKRRLVGQTRAKLSHQLGREPSLEELAEELHVGVDDLITLLSMPSRLDSLQRPLTSDTETTVGAMTQDRETETPLEEILSTEKHAVNKAEILRKMERLNRNEQIAIKLRFGIGTKDGAAYTLEEAGDLLAVSRERVRQLEVSGLARMKDEKGRAQNAVPPLADHADTYLVENRIALPHDERFEGLAALGLAQLEGMLKGLYLVTRGGASEQLYFPKLQYAPSLTGIDRSVIRDRIEALLNGRDINIRGRIQRAAFSEEQIRRYPQLLSLEPDEIFRRESLVRQSTSKYSGKAYQVRDDILGNRIHLLTMTDFGRDFGDVPPEIALAMTAAEKRVYELSFGADGQPALADDKILQTLEAEGIRGFRGEPYGMQGLLLVRARALNHLASGKTGMDLLADDLGFARKEITQDMFWDLRPADLALIQHSYGIGVQKAADMGEIEARFRTLNIGMPTKQDQTVFYTESSLMHLRSETLKRLRERKSGWQRLSEETGIAVPRLKELAWTLTERDWKIVRYVHGLDTPRTGGWKDTAARFKAQGVTVSADHLRHKYAEAMATLKENKTGAERLAADAKVRAEWITPSLLAKLPAVHALILGRTYGIGMHVAADTPEIIRELAAKGHGTLSRNTVGRNALKRGRLLLHDYLLGDKTFTIKVNQFVRRLYFEKRDAELLAAHAKIEPSDLTEARWLMLTKVQREVLEYYYGLNGKGPVRHFPQLAAVLYKNKITPKQLGAGRVGLIRRQALAVLGAHASGLHWLAADAGKTVEDVMRNFGKLAAGEAETLLMDYGIREQRLGHYRDVAREIARRQPSLRKIKINQDKVGHWKQDALQRLKGELPEAKWPVRTIPQPEGSALGKVLAAFSKAELRAGKPWEATLESFFEETFGGRRDLSAIDLGSEDPPHFMMGLAAKARGFIRAAFVLRYRFGQAGLDEITPAGEGFQAVERKTWTGLYSGLTPVVTDAELRHRFDVVTANAPQGDVNEYLQEARELLAPGGVLLMRFHRLNTRLGDVLQKRHEAWGWDLQVFPQGLIGYPNSRDNFQYDSLYVLRPKPELRTLGAPEGWPRDYTLPEAVLEPGQTLAATSRALDPEGMPLDLPERRIVKRLGAGLASTVYLVEDPASGERFVEKYFGRIKGEGSLGKSAVGLFYSLTRGAPFGYRHNPFAILAAHKTNVVINDLYHLDRGTDQDFTPRLRYTRYDEATGSYVQAYDYVEGRKIRLDEVRAAKAFLNERYAFLAKRLGFWGLARQTDTRNLNALGNILQTPAGEKVLVDVVPGVPGGVFWLLPLEFPYFVRGLLNGRLFPFADAIDFAKLHRFVDGLAAQEKASPETAAELHRRIDDLRQTVSEWRNAERQYRGAYRLWVLRRLLSKIRDLSWMRRAWGFLIGLPGKGLRAAGRSIRHAALWVWVPAYRHASVMQWLETRIEKGLEHGVIDAGEAHDLRAEIARGPARMLKLLSLYPVYALPNLVKPPGVGTAVNAVSLMAFFSTWNPWFLALVFMDGTYRALVTLAMTWRSPAVYAALFSFVPTLGFVWGPAAELQKEYPRLAAFLLRSYFWKAGAAFPGVDTISSRAMFYARLAGIPLAVNQIFLNVLGGLGALLKRQKPRAAAGEPAPKTELRTQDLGAPDLFEKSEIEEMHERLPLLREGWKHWDAAAKEMLLEPSFLLMLLGIKPGYFKSTFEEAPPLKFFGAVTKAFDERMMVAVPNRDRMNPLAVSLPQAARAFSRNRELLRANGLVLDDRYLDAFDAFAQDPFSYDPSYLEHYIWTLFGQAVKSDAALDAFMGTLSGYPAEDIRDYIRLGGRQLARQGRLGEAMTMHETEFRNVFLWGRKQGSPEAERQRARYRAALYYAYAQFRGFEGFREIAERIGLPADVFTADVPASLKSEMRLETILLDAANVAALQPKELAKKGMSAVEMEGMAPMKIDEAGPALDSVQRMIEDKLTGVKQFLLVLDADSKTARLYLTEPQELGPSNADALSVPALAAQGVSRLQIEGMPAVELASAEALLAGVRKPLQEGMLGQSKILLVVPPKSGTAFLIYRAAVPAPAEKASPGLVEKTFSGSGPGARAIDMVFDRGTLAALEQYDRENGDNVLERLERIVSQHPDLSKLKDGKGNPDLWQPGDYDELVGGQDIKRTVRILFKKPVMIGGEAADAIDITGVLFSDQNLGENFRHIAVIGPEWKMYSDRPESESRATEFSMDRDGKPLLTEGRWAQVGGHGAASAKRKFFRARDILPAQGLRGPLAAAYGEYHVKQAAGKDIQKDGLKLGVFVSLRRKDSPGRFDEPLKKMIHGFYEEYVRRRARVPPGVPMSLDDLLRRAMAQPLDMAQDRRDQVEIASHYDFASLYQRYGREIRGLIDKELYPEQPHWGNVTIDMSGKLPTTWHDLGGWRLGNDPDTGPLTREQKFGYTYFVLYKALAAIQGHLYGDVQKPLYINQIVDPYTEFLKGFFHDQLRNPLFKRSDLGFGENNEPEAMGKVLYNPRFDERYRVLRPLEPPIHERRDAPFVPLLRQMFGFDAASKTELRSGEIVVHTVRSDPDYIDRVNRFLGSPEHPIVLKGGYSLEALEKILRGRERVQVHALRMLEEPESQYDHFHPYVDRPSSEEAIVAETLRGLKDGTIAYEESTGRFYMVFDNSMGRQTEPNMRWVVFDRTGNEVLALAPFRIFSRLVDEGKIDRLDRFLGEKEELYRILDEDAGSGARTELRPDAVSLSWSAASAAAASLAAYGGAALGAGAWGAVLGVVPVFFLLRAAYQFFRFQALKAALGSETAKYLAPGAYTHVLEHKDYPRQVIIAKRGPRAMEAHIAVRMPRLTDAGEGKIYRALARKGFAAKTVYAGKVRMENIRIRLTGAAGEDRLLQDKRYPKDQLSVYLQERGIPLNTFVKSHPGLRDQVTRDFLDFIRAMWREGFVDLDIGFRNYMVRLDAEGRPLKKDGRFVLAVHDFGAIYRRPAAEEDLVRLLAESGGADVARGLLLIAAFTHKREKEIREQLFPHTDLTPAIALLERAERAREGFQGLDAKARYMAVLKSPESRALVLRTLQSMAAEIHAHAELRTSGAEGFLSAGLKEARPELRSSETPNLGGVPSVTFEGDTYELVDEAAQAYWNAGKKFVLKLFDASADPGIPARIQLMQESLKKSGVPGVEYLRAVSVDVQGARRPALQLRFSAADTEDEVRRLFSSKAPARYAEAQALAGGFVTLPPESEPSNPEDLTRSMEQAGNSAQSVRLVSKNFTDGLWEAKYEISFAAPEGPQKIIYVLNYPESPEPLPVGLVLHGWQVSKDEPFVAELAKAVARQGYAVVRPDFRNHHGKMWNEQARVMDDNRNESSGEIADFKWGQSLEDVSRVAAALQAGTDLPRLTLEGALLFGYSYGGWTARTVAQAAARQTGGFNGLKVRAVFDFASPADPTASLFSIVKGRMVSQGLTSGAAFDKARELMDAWYQKPAAGGAWQGGLPWFLSASRPHNPIFERPFLRQVAHYYFIGQKDTILFGLQPMTDLVNAAAGRAVLSGAESRLTVIKGMGHFFTPEYRPAVVANVAGIAQRLRMSSAIPFSSSFPVQVLDLSKAPKPRPLKRGFDRLFPLHASARTRKLTAAALLEILRRHGLNQEHLGSDAKGFYVTVEKSIGGHVRQLSAVQADIEREYPGAYRFDTIPVLDRGDYQLQILRGSKKKSELRVQPGTFKLFHENKSAGVSYKILAEWQKDHDDPNSMFYILEKSGTHKRFVLKAFPESREWKLGGRFSGANLVSYEKVTDESGHRMLLSPLVPRSKLAESPGLAAKPHEAYLPQEVDDFIVTIDEKWGRSDPRYIDAWIRLLADSLAAQRQLTDAGFYFDDSFFPNLWVTDDARGHVRAMLGDADGVASLSAVPRKILADDYVFSIMIEEWAGFFLAHAGTDARFAPFKELLEQVDFSAVKTGAQLKRRLTAFETEVRRAAGFALKIKNRVELRGVDGEANGQVEMGTVWRVYHRQLLITRLRKEMAAGRLRELTVNGESILRNGEGVRPGLDRAFVASYVVRQMPMDHFPFEYEWRNEGASLAIRRKPAAAWHFSGEEPPSRTELRSLEDVNPWNDAKEWDYIPGESGWDARKRRDAYLAKKEPLVRRHLEVLNGVEGAEKQIEKWLQVHGSTREWGFFLARRKDTGALRVIMDLMGTGTGAGAGPYGLGEYFPNQVLSYYMALRLLETGTQGEALEEIVAEGHTHIFSPGGIPFSPGDYGQNRYTSSSLVYMTGAPRPFFELAPVEIHDTALIARLEREGWQENRMWYGGGTSHYHVPSGDYLRHFMRNFEAAHFAVKSELRKVEAPRKAGRPGFEDKRIFVDYNDMAAHFSDAQIKEILFTAGEKHRSFLIVVYGVDVTQTLGNFLAGLKLPSLRATAADLPAAAREFTRGFAGERLHLSSAAGEISPQALAAALDENGKNRANLYALAYRDGEGGTLGVALKDLDRRLLAEYTEAGLLKKQLPDYMGFDEKGRIIVTDLRAAGAEAWQSAYESAIAFSRAA